MRFEPDPIEDQPSKPSGSFQTASQVFQPSSTGRRHRGPTEAGTHASQTSTLTIDFRKYYPSSATSSIPQPLARKLYRSCWTSNVGGTMRPFTSSDHRSPTLVGRAFPLRLEGCGTRFKTPESLPDNCRRACSQLRAIRNYSNRKLNPPKAIAHPTHVFGTVGSIPPSQSLQADSTFSNEQDMMPFEDPSISSQSFDFQFNTPITKNHLPTKAHYPAQTIPTTTTTTATVTTTATTKQAVQTTPHQILNFILRFIIHRSALTRITSIIFHDLRGLT
ncbi:hypothetical protein Pst134EB_009979 [Puccinia striiformis f. sp. tritici]|nr:hypothetical protein Pst134EB_009979 [Puccinia striiformis f. sp. tritici]